MTRKKKKDKNTKRISSARDRSKVKTKTSAERETSKHKNKGSAGERTEINLWKTLSGVLAIALLFTVVWAVFYASSPNITSSRKTTSQESGAQGDQLIFISSSACQKCNSYASDMKHIASSIGASYRKVDYMYPVSYPGFILIRNGTLYLTGFEDREQLYRIICTITNSTKICEEYNKIVENNVNKTDKPVVKFFVMSFCPFGQQMEKVMYPVYKKFKGLVTFDPHYVIYSNYGGKNYCYDKNERYCSMHGRNEVVEDVRQLCIKKYYDSDTWWKYVMYVDDNCSINNINTCWKDAAKYAGINTTKIENCVSNEAEQLLEAELQLNHKYNVRGSPTVFINGVLYRGERTPQAFQNMLCKSFTNAPALCNTSVNASTASASGSCG